MTDNTDPQDRPTWAELASSPPALTLSTTVPNKICVYGDEQRRFHFFKGRQEAPTDTIPRKCECFPIPAQLKGKPVLLEEWIRQADRSIVNRSDKNKEAITVNNVLFAALIGAVVSSGMTYAANPTHDQARNLCRVIVFVLILTSVVAVALRLDVAWWLYPHQIVKLRALKELYHRELADTIAAIPQPPASADDEPGKCLLRRLFRSNGPGRS